ncbi:unnamed protein product [Rotaria magnacalcarata]|uniref:Uncharacterized protein n=1 Tax=Rotaria magnacalcarata TaxID=392030 RepID=A0A816UP54_9BILA|nr:unnamed protein product [Rotaria magnacalcarata]
MQRFSKILIDARINEVTANEIKQALISSEQKALKASIGHLTENFDNLPIPDFVNTSQQTINLRSTNTVDTYSNTNNNSYSTRKQSNYDASRFQSIVSKNLVNGSHQSKATDSKQSITKTKAFTPTIPLPPSEVLPIDDTVNILLFGETGVGKSTFFNAFAILFI